MAVTPVAEMGLIDAIRYEMDGDLAEAVNDYESVSELGSTLDRAGIWDALARVETKQGNLLEAAEWQVQSARAFLNLPEDAMEPDEAMYQALTRFRQAFANWTDDPQYRPSVMEEYGLCFDHCWEAFPGGITHEALFYAKALEITDSPGEAAEVYEEVAELMAEDLEEEDEEEQIVREIYEAAAKAWEDAGDGDRADAALEKFQDHGGELPEEEEVEA